MADESPAGSGARPDHSLRSSPAQRGEKPAIELVRFFQVREADYMKPPLQEQLMEPDGEVAPTADTRLAGNAACTCNSVCTCVPVSICACNTVCTCNTVNTSYAMTQVDPPPVAELPKNLCTAFTTPPPPCTHMPRPPAPTRPPTCRHTVRGGGGGGYGGYYAPCF